MSLYAIDAPLEVTFECRQHLWLLPKKVTHENECASVM
jgi:hypothetical protein